MKKRSSLKIFPIICILLGIYSACPPCVTIAQENPSNIGYAKAESLDPRGVGAKALAMGGAFIGVADDPTAIWWNPAGLTQVEGITFLASIQSKNNEVERNQNFLGNTTIRDDYNSLTFNYVSMVFPLKLFGMKSAFATGLEYHGNLTQLSENITMEMGYFTISPAFAFKFSKATSIGIALNIRMGESKGNRLDYDPIENDPYSYQGSSQLIRTTSKYKGNNVSIGLHLDLRKMEIEMPVSMGFVFKNSFDLKNNSIEERRRSSLSYVRHLLHKTDIPAMVGMGIEWEPFKILSFTMDIERRFWRSSFVRTKYSPQIHRLYDVNQSGLNKTHIRLGSELRRKTLDALWSFRIGYARIPTLLADYDGVQYGQQVISNIYSTGLGFKKDRYSIDLAWSLESFERDLSTVSGIMEKSKQRFRTIKVNLCVFEQ